jgi:hypothetical protein
MLVVPALGLILHRHHLHLLGHIVHNRLLLSGWLAFAYDVDLRLVLFDFKFGYFIFAHKRKQFFNVRNSNGFVPVGMGFFTLRAGRFFLVQAVSHWSRRSFRGNNMALGSTRMGVRPPQHYSILPYSMVELWHFHEIRGAQGRYGKEKLKQE